MLDMRDVVVQELVRLQDLERLSGEQFARKLGIPASEWSRVRRGLRGLGMESYVRALRVYPHLGEMLTQAVTLGNVPNA